MTTYAKLAPGGLRRPRRILGITGEISRQDHESQKWEQSQQQPTRQINNEVPILREKRILSSSRGKWTTCLYEKYFQPWTVVAGDGSGGNLLFIRRREWVVPYLPIRIQFFSMKKLHCWKLSSLVGLRIEIFTGKSCRYNDCEMCDIMVELYLEHYFLHM